MKDSNHNHNGFLTLPDLYQNFLIWLKFVFGKWKILLVAMLIGVTLGVVYSIVRKPIYTAESTFVLEEGKSSGGLGQYAGLASMVGIDIASGGTGLFSSDNILQLYTSRTMIVKALLTEVPDDESRSRLVDRYISSYDLNKKWKDSPELHKLSYADTTSLSITQDSILTEIYKEIRRKSLVVTKPDKKLSIILVSFSSHDQIFAKYFVETLVNNVSQFYIETKTKKNVENIQILQHQTDSVRAVLNGAIFRSAATLDATPNLNPAKQVLRTPMQRSQFVAETNKAILSELIKNLELSKLTLRQETPLIQIIDRPTLPLSINKIGTGKAGLFGGVLFFAVAMAFLSLKYMLTKSS